MSTNPNEFMPIPLEEGTSGGVAVGEKWEDYAIAYYTPRDIIPKPRDVWVGRFPIHKMYDRIRTLEDEVEGLQNIVRLLVATMQEKFGPLPK